jgi:hypothetical protein
MGIALRALRLCEIMKYKTTNRCISYSPALKVHSFTYMDVGKGRELGAGALPTLT